MTAFFVLIEALLTDVARLLGEDAILALKRREALIDQLKPFS
jgi:DNA-binding MurR/RpiR family transcriptional regulator